MLAFQVDDVDQGVIAGVDNELEVVASSPEAKSVDVSTGAALPRGRFYRNDAALTLSLDENTSGDPRIDRVALRIDYASQTVRVAVLKGTPASSPAAPALTQTAGVTWDVPLAQVYLAHNYSTVTASDITDERRFTGLPNRVMVALANGSGSDLDAGAVVVLDTSAAEQFTTSTTVGAAGVIGALAAGVADSAEAAGVAQVNVTGAVAIGDYLQQSSAAGAAEADTGGYRFAIALEANASGDGSIKALLGAFGYPAVGCTAYRSGGLGLSSGWQTVTLNSEYADTYDMHSTSTNSSRVTVPVDGKYLISGHITYQSLSASREVGMAIAINGSRIREIGNFTTGGQQSLSISIVVNVAAGDYIELQNYFNVGPLNIYDPTLTVVLIGAQ
jgi:hypothetical protein